MVTDRVEKAVSKAKEQSIFASWTWRSFLFISLFHVLHISLFLYGWLSITEGPPMPGLSKLNVSIHISRGAAVPLSLHLMLLLLPMCRLTTTQLRIWFKWFPIEECTWFHRQVAYNMLGYTIIHTASHYVNFYLIEKDKLRPDKAMQIHYTQAAGITGHIMLFSMLLIYTLAHAKIRHQAFEAFQWGHRLYPIFLLAAWTHGSGCFVRNTVQPYDILDRKDYWAHCVGYQSWRWEAWFSVLYILERLYTILFIQRRAHVSRVLQHPSNVLEIQFDRGEMEYKAGQWIFLKCPEFSKTQWHPFSISSCPYDPYVSVHIRQVGDFTKGLREVFEAGINPAAYDISYVDPAERSTAILHERLQVRENPRIVVEGPYGSPAEAIFDCEVAILIGAGIGVTPWASVLKSLWHIRGMKGEEVRLRRVEFIWTCKDLTMFEWFQNLITSLNNQSDALEESDTSIRLSCHTYITRPPPSFTNPAPTKSRMDTISEGASAGEKEPQRMSSTKSTSSTRSTNSTHSQRQNNHIHTGRPDFKSVFTDIRDTLEMKEDSSIRGRLRRRKQIGVSFCGPKVMAKDIMRACTEVTTGDVKFRFKKETF